MLPASLGHHLLRNRKEGADGFAPVNASVLGGIYFVEVTQEEHCNFSRQMAQIYISAFQNFRILSIQKMQIPATLTELAAYTVPQPKPTPPPPRYRGKMNQQLVIKILGRYYGY